METISKRLEVLFSDNPTLKPKLQTPQLELQYAKILEQGTLEALGPETPLYRTGKPVENIFFILDGEASELFHTSSKDANRNVQIRTVGPGRWLGLYDLLGRKPHSTSAKMLREGFVLKFEPQLLFHHFYNNPDLRNLFVRLNVLNRLRTIPFLASCPTTILGFLADACDVKDRKVDEKIYKIGDAVDQIYVIDKGQVSLKFESDSAEIWLGNSAPFGFRGSPDQGMMTNAFYDLDHTASAWCPTTTFGWPRSEFMRITGISPEKVGMETRSAAADQFLTLPMVKNLDEAQRFRLLGFVGHYVIPQHQLLMQQGEFADSMWVLMPQSQATLYAYDRSRNLQTTPVIGPVSVNERAILRALLPCPSTLQAEPNSQWLRLHVDDFEEFAKQDAKLKKFSLINQKDELSKIFGISVPKVTSDVVDKLEFELQPGEVFEFLDRRHWIVCAQKMLPGLIIFALIVVFWIIVSVTGTSNLWFDVSVLLALLICGVQMGWGWLDYRNDFLMVTNMRVVHQEKVVFFSERQQTALMEQVRDIKVERKTVLGNFFGYGDIYIQTTAKSSILFDRISDPEQVQNKIREVQDRRNRHFLASGRWEIYNALERQLGLKNEIPTTVWRAAKAQVEPKISGSLWQLLFRPQGRKQLITDGGQDRIVWRKHWIVLIGKLVAPGLLALLMTGLSLGLMIYYVWGGMLAWGILGIPVGLVSMFFWTWLWWTVQDWYNDTYEVNATEVIDTEMKPLFFPIYFDKEVRKGSLNDTNEITYSIPTILNYLLNFGNVLIETSSPGGRFTFDNVPDPAHVAEEVRRKVAEFYERQRNEENRRRAAEFPVWFEMYERLGNERVNRDTEMQSVQAGA